MQQKKSDNEDEYSGVGYILPTAISSVDEKSEEFQSIDPEPNRDFPTDLQVVTAQICRSFCNWSGGISLTETSIQQAYINLIQSSEKFIYIENQFFVTTLAGFPEGPQKEVNNRLG